MAQELVTLSYTHPTGEQSWGGTSLCELSFQCYDLQLVSLALEVSKRVLAPLAGQFSQFDFCTVLMHPAALELVANLEIPPQVEFVFDIPVGIDSPPNLPDVIIDATIEGVHVTLPAEWKPIINQTGDAWKQSREYKILLCGLCLFYKMLFS